MTPVRMMVTALLLALSGITAPATAQVAANAPDSATTPRLSVAQLRARYADRQSRYMTIGGMEIHYKDEGPRQAPVLPWTM